MGADENTVEQPPQDTASSDSVDALLEAARYDDIDDLMSIASSGVSLDSKDSEGRTALHMASANGHLGIVEYLIHNGAMKRGFIIKARGLCVGTVSVEQLVKHSPSSLTIGDVNACNSEKNTPLHWASLNGHIEIVKRLILSGASLSLLNSHERSPIDEAVSRGKMDVIDAINEAAAQVELAGAQVE